MRPVKLVILAIILGAFVSVCKFMAYCFSESL